MRLRTWHRVLMMMAVLAITAPNLVGCGSNIPSSGTQINPLEGRESELEGQRGAMQDYYKQAKVDARKSKSSSGGSNYGKSIEPSR